MKTIGKYFAFIVIVIAGTWLFPQQVRAQYEENEEYDSSIQNEATPQDGPVTLQLFYDELSSYGTWISDPNYGYVWAPNVDRDFRPYVTNGHWINTDYGWTWVSDFPWGWAAFHYGRWTIDPRYGYVWIPDTVWGPAWVSWRQSDGYVGWTPMGPGVNIDIALGSSYYVPYDRWTFVRDRDFLQVNLFGYCLGRSLISSIFNTTFVIRSTHFDSYRHCNYFYGPSREYVQRYTGRVINPVRIRDYNRPGQTYANGYLNIYRPQIQRGNVYGRHDAPRSYNNMAGRNVQNSYRSYETPGRNVYSTGRNVQTAQQPAQNGYRSQSVQQPSRFNNSEYRGRGGVNAQEPSRFNNPGRGSVTAQQPERNSYKSQDVPNPSHYAVSNNPGRGAQPAVQQRFQREERVVQTPNRQEGSRMSSNASSERVHPSYNQREGNSRGSSDNERGRR